MDLFKHCNLSEYARQIGVARTTVIRWTKVGYMGVKLETVQLGRQRFVTPESHARFRNALNVPKTPAPKRGRGRPRKHPKL